MKLTQHDCKLCKGGPENEQHFVLECPALEEKRKSYKEKTKYNLEQVFSQEQSNEIINNSEKLLQLYLDCTTMFDKHNRKNPDSMTMLGQRWYRVVRLAYGWGWKYNVGPTLPQR